MERRPRGPLSKAGEARSQDHGLALERHSTAYGAGHRFSIGLVARHSPFVFCGARTVHPKSGGTPRLRLPRAVFQRGSAGRIVQGAQRRFFESLPVRLRWGHDKATPGWGTRDRIIRTAAYVELPTNKWHYLILDIDHPGAGAFWYNEGLPEPTINIRTPENGHALYFYELAVPVLRPINGGASWLSRRALEYFANIRAGYIKALCADPGYTTFSCKNPLSATWSPSTLWHERRYTLDELAKCVEVPSSTRRIRRIRPEDCTSPHSRMFHAGRQWAVEHVGDFDTLGSFETTLHAYLEGYYDDEVRPGLEHEIGSHLIASQVKKIARYTWDRRDTSWLRDERKRRGALDLPPVCHRLSEEEREAEVAERQRLGARYANEERKRRTQEAVLSAMDQLRQAGKPVTKSGVAALAGVSRQTLHRYYRHLFVDAA